MKEEGEDGEDFKLHQQASSPHTLSGLVVMLAVLFPVFFFIPPNRDIEEGIRVGLFSCATVFLFYCTIQLQDGELRRPHVVVWRFVHGLTILNLLLVVFLLAQSSSRAVDLTMQVVFNDPVAGTAALPKFENNDYSISCHLTLENVQSKVFDRYFVAHLLGWVVKALILRDWQMMWACSLLFEVLEVSLQRLLPNFSECWWDRWILDVWGCNLLGMYLGIKLAAYLGAREYDWQMNTNPSSRSTSPRIWIRKLTSPQVFPKRYDWHVFASWRAFGISLVVLFVVLWGEINGFLLKSSLQLGNASYLMAYRLVLVSPAVYASVVELYAFSEQRTNRIGRTAWLVVGLGVLEFVLAMKNFKLRQAFSEEQWALPWEVKMGWLGSFFFALLLLVLKLTRRWWKRNHIQMVGRLAVLPFGYLLAWDAWKHGGLEQQFLCA